MKTPIKYADFIKLYDFSRQLALALADEAMFVEQRQKLDGGDGPSENTLMLLSRARVELNLEKPFDELDSLKPLLDTS